jgi:hypothetical protein
MLRKSLVAVAALMIVSACGTETSPPAGAADVVTLQTGAAASASPPAQGRPVIRPDATSEDIQKLVNAQFACWEEHGSPQYKGPDGNYNKPPEGVTLPEADPAVIEAADRACAHLEPESWLDVERRTNPEFADMIRAAAECLKARGYDARFVQDPEVGIGYRDLQESLAADEDDFECKREAFASRAGLYG